MDNITQILENLVKYKSLKHVFISKNLYNNAYCWVHRMCKELFMLWTIVSQTFQYSMRPNFLALVIIQVMIVTESQIPNCGSKGYCWSFNTLKKRRTCVRENSWNLRKHCDMHECENKTIFEAWRICGSNLEWHTNWPKLMQLWQKIILIPSSIAICERGFSKQNAIKSHLRNRLNLKTLDALMRVSLCGLEVDAMDWSTIFNIWRNMRDRMILTLDW
jgi:hypothetical protein